MTNAYDGFGRLSSSTINMDGVSRALAHQYDAAGNRTRLTHPGGQAFSYDHDPAGRLENLYEGTGTTVMLAHFEYSDRGLPESRTGGGATSSYGHDAIGRLSALTHNFVGTAADQSLGFTRYNPASQIVARTSSNDAYASDTAYDVSRPYSVNGLNQYTAAGPATFAYDANGNLISDGSTNFTYDVENRLVAASGAKTASLRYDPLGRLYEVGGASGTTRFLYDGDALAAQYNTAGTLLRRYVHGSSAAADDPLIWYEGAAVSAATRRSLFADHQGSIVAVADSAGNALAINAYDAWGIPNAANVGRFQYTGQVWIAELGMYYYKARVYSPTLGRFLQVDPIGYDDQIHLYAYVGNDPVNHTDPDGSITSCIPVGVRPSPFECRPGRMWASAEASQAPEVHGRSGRPRPRGFLVDLVEQEALGGHTIAFHVNKSHASLINRVNASRIRSLFVTLGLRRAGSFTSLNSATRLTNATLSSNPALVQRVARGEAPSARLDRRFGSPTGYEAYTTGRSTPVIRPTYGVTVWVVHDAGTPEGFRVHTSYPSNQD